MRHLQTLRLIQDVARAGSIRKAAEDQNITSSALNRRIQAFEAEFGSQIFERLPRGVRLNPAGELLMQHIRSQISDLERIRGQVADLSGARRGHVSIACSQAVNPIFLPEQISRYRADHPAVTFSVRVRDRAAAERELSTFSSDLALVFEPIYLADFEVIKAIPQPVCAVMAADHPLAGALRPPPARLPRRAPHGAVRGIRRPAPARARHPRPLPPPRPGDRGRQLRDDAPVRALRADRQLPDPDRPPRATPASSSARSPSATSAAACSCSARCAAAPCRWLRPSSRSNSPPPSKPSPEACQALSR